MRAERTGGEPCVDVRFYEPLASGDCLVREIANPAPPVDGFAGDPEYGGNVFESQEFRRVVVHVSCLPALNLRPKVRKVKRFLQYSKKYLKTRHKVVILELELGRKARLK
jgi:hypothetical protein